MIAWRSAGSPRATGVEADYLSCIIMIITGGC